ncbi:MAG: hypothetical protein A2W93_02730 [Bacteroidetes bacterium GWF2_43_63]|nr:MAG: hypothetical protein A2W94_08735 [Bacteroidetes bacterium GWE2_42_42]OFY53583.1 MAG: hypothetical protein A2W93_02730 [Bacteroidetes bacterium GWF2_43_63]HBG71084.1 hypothetical protein [Bacteroidales bacterium]HCB63662.1 hypothetical protein [Bacteroidales bacterium]HCY24411.1 hypothetical protein [Bacteroidales bacterium]
MNNILANLHRFEVKDEDFDHQSFLHGRLHTHRVMAWVCVLAQKLNMDGQGRLAFFAAKVHDLGRLTDGREPGHGLRSADEFLPYYRGLFEEFGLQKCDYLTVYNAVKWHSKSEEPAAETENIDVIHLLKDADGLDRVRLGDDEPDIRFFRNEISKRFASQARQLHDITEAEPTISLQEIVALAFELSK